ncbi:MAG: phosphate--acyl-ACP acyltransferase, partial [Acidobacteriaceae bacterium]|nr:phosphate--acyl-ACP acyltransferase [Acidobacteriaceae bacterium]
MVTIALDAMGGDHFPKSEVEGALEAVKAFDVKVVLVGREEAICKELDLHPDWKSLPLEIKHASEQITMEDS